MSESPRVPDPIDWHEGMLLSPQHFQEADRRLERLFQFYGAQWQPYSWGVRHWDLDETLLAHGRFRLHRLEAVMPDGLALCFRETEAHHLELDLSDRLELLRTRPRKIYLGVVRAEEVRHAEADAPRRFREVEGAAVVDRRSGSRVHIPRLSPRPRLFLDRPPGLYSAFPLAELAYNGNVLQLTEFHPPVPAVTDDLEIAAMCHRVTALLRRKANHLSGLLSTGQGEDGSRAEVERNLVHLVGGLPLFETVLRSHRPHPFQLYQALVQLMSHLVPLSRSKVPPLLEPYDHDDLRTTFGQVYQTIVSILEARIQETFSEAAFRKDGETYTLEFLPEWRGKELIVGFAREPGSREREAANWIAGALIGKAEEIPTLRSNRILGIQRESIDQVTGLVTGQDMLLYRMGSGSERLHAGDRLIISPSAGSDTSFSPTSLSLYVRNDAPAHS
ncbi:Type VI secretion system baseplate subunit TssK [Sulfidibacter corallicola]|uniref:Type VI secretion system baseplate subunit TssK n=1 Tax=Sulfidibacter corallicola TaxID=2818388 RepID=A0A8A4TP41_SULCO|nr:type VI secretion system baseplate subunit TssK [Sulfidibacter corallicola]QTD50964.1 type VI secretion system baseplate subunit TssK [Sulfidibacter corallicola]